MADTLFAQLEKDFLLSKEQLTPIVDGFNLECQTGLKTPSKGLATMIPSFVTKMPTGNEKGSFLSLDLGGTNLRVAAVELKGNGKSVVHELKRRPTMELKTGEGAIFFDWIADAIKELIQVEAKTLFNEDQLQGKDSLSLGVCWSFPVE
jgi:hexokinase